MRRDGGEAAAGDQRCDLRIVAGDEGRRGLQADRVRWRARRGPDRDAHGDVRVGDDVARLAAGPVGVDVEVAIDQRVQHASHVRATLGRRGGQDAEPAIGHGIANGGLTKIGRGHECSLGSIVQVAFLIVQEACTKSQPISRSRMSRRAREPAGTERVITLISLVRRTGQLMVEEITTRLEAAGFPDSPPTFHPIFENLDPAGTRLTTLAARYRADAPIRR